MLLNAHATDSPLLVLLSRQQSSVPVGFKPALYACVLQPGNCSLWISVHRQRLEQLLVSPERRKHAHRALSHLCGSDARALGCILFGLAVYLRDLRSDLWIITYVGFPKSS